jgi:hypothetical protein
MDRSSFVSNAWWGIMAGCRAGGKPPGGPANGSAPAGTKTDKSFLVLFFKKEQDFFLKKEAKTFIR